MLTCTLYLRRLPAATQCALAVAVLACVAAGATPASAAAAVERTGPPAEEAQQPDPRRCLPARTDRSLTISSNPSCVRVVAGVIRQALAAMDAEDAAEMAADAAAERKATERRKKRRPLPQIPEAAAPRLHSVPLLPP